MADARQRLIENSADRRIVVGDENIAANGHLRSPSPSSSAPNGASFQAGIRMRKVVPRGVDSHSMMPPCSPTILATSASPSPEPFGLVVMKGSNRIGRISSETPEPLSRTQNSSGSDT